MRSNHPVRPRRESPNSLYAVGTGLFNFSINETKRAAMQSTTRLLKEVTNTGSPRSTQDTINARSSSVFPVSAPPAMQIIPLAGMLRKAIVCCGKKRKNFEIVNNLFIVVEHFDTSQFMCGLQRAANLEDLVLFTHTSDAFLATLHFSKCICRFPPQRWVPQR